MVLKAASPVWLFDLDNTLHNASPHIFPHLNSAMVTYIRDHLGVDEQAATRIRQDYWQRYGATLLGLMRHHGTDPRHFLWHTHQFPNLKQMLVLERVLVLERGLRTMLLGLPGRKIVFSNAPLHYSEAVLELAGIDTCFDAVYSIERLRFQPKPAIGGFRHPAALRAFAHPSLHHGRRFPGQSADGETTGHANRVGEWQYSPAFLC